MLLALVFGVLLSGLPALASSPPDASPRGSQKSTETHQKALSSQPADKGAAPLTGTAEKKVETPPPFPIGSKLSRGVQKYTGVTWLSEFVTGQVAKIIIHHKLGGKVKVRVKTYSLTDLIAGKLKVLDVRLDDSHVYGVGLGRIHASSSGPLWVAPLKKKDRRSGLQNPVVLKVEGELSQKDVTEALVSPEVAQQLRGLKLDLPGLGEQQLEVLKPVVSIKENLVRIEATLVTRGAAEETGVPLVITAKPVLKENTKIFLEDLTVDSDCIVEPEKFAAFIADLLNPIVDFGRYDRGDHAFRLTSFHIKDKVVTGDGNLLLVPRGYKPNSTAGGNGTDPM